MTKAKAKPEEQAVVATEPVQSVSIRTADVIASEIRFIDAQARQYVLQSAIEIGNRLNEAKELVTHGEWAGWLQSNVSYSKSTANNFMKISNEYTGSQSFTNLSYSQAVALLSLPADDREEFVANNNVEDMSTRELQAAIKEKQELEQKLKEEQIRVEAQKENFDKWAEDQGKQREALYEQYQAELNLRKEQEDKARALEIELENAQKVGDSKEAAKLKAELRKAEKTMSQATTKTSELEEALKNKDAENERLIAERLHQQQAELAEQMKQKEDSFQQQISKLEQQLQRSNNEAFMKFKLQFNQFTAGFDTLLKSMAEVQESEEQAKLKNALMTAIDKMKSTL